MHSPTRSQRLYKGSALYLKVLLWGEMGMGVFDRFFAKKMSESQAREFAQGELSKFDELHKGVQGRFDVLLQETLSRLDVQDKMSLASLVRARLSILNNLALTSESQAVVAQVVRECLELCARAPVGGGVRQLVVQFEPILQDAQDVLERRLVFVTVLRALDGLGEIAQEKQAYAEQVRALDAQVIEAQLRCDSVKREKDALLASPDVVALKTQLNVLGAERKWVQEQIRAAFDPVLPLFARTEHPLLSSYVDDPVKALASDFSLSVIKEAQVLASSLRRDGFPDTVALAQAGSLQQSILAPLVHRYGQARKQEERLLRQLELLPQAGDVARLGRALREEESARDDIKKARSELVEPSEVRLRSALLSSLKALNISLV